MRTWKASNVNRPDLWLSLLSGAARSDTSPSSAARPAKSTATTAENPATWRKNAPSRPPLNPVSLLAPPFSD